MHGLYALVDVPCPRGFSATELTQAVLGERTSGGYGARTVQLRAKSSDTRARVELARAMLPLCHTGGARLIINDDFEAARSAGADGVHLGQQDLREIDLRSLRTLAPAQFTVGLSTHNEAQFRHACARPFDYLALGPIFATASKRTPEPTVGLEQLEHLARPHSGPVVAIGGLDADSGVDALARGATAVAVIGALRKPTLEAIRFSAIRLAEAFETTSNFFCTEQFRPSR